MVAFVDLASISETVQSHLLPHFLGFELLHVSLEFRQLVLSSRGDCRPVSQMQFGYELGRASLQVLLVIRGMWYCIVRLRQLSAVEEHKPLDGWLLVSRRESATLVLVMPRSLCYGRDLKCRGSRLTTL